MPSSWSAALKCAWNLLTSGPSVCTKYGRGGSQFLTTGHTGLDLSDLSGGLTHTFLIFFFKFFSFKVSAVYFSAVTVTLTELLANIL